MKTLDSYPDWICYQCAIENGGHVIPGRLATFHMDLCDVCKREKAVTECRDYGYPKFKIKKEK